jgi:UDP-2,3-diacylglucosamine pyrophosphatase LpxH
MRIAVISDLHLSHEPALKRLDHELGPFMRFLGFLEAEHERVVLLGDMNSGTCMGRRFEYLCLDTRTASFLHLDSW